jgi:hypothetical protein
MSLPKWATAPTKDAVATEQGWKSPKGELLVSHKGLKSKLDELAPKKAPKKAAKKKEEATDEE